MDDLSPTELVQLAMLAFIHMYDTGDITKEELLEDIMTWFHIMTDDIEQYGVEQVIFPDDEGGSGRFH